jgi:hypothetical protein
MRQIPLEFGEVARDYRHVEASKNYLLWLAVEQETKCGLKTAFRRMLTGCQSLVSFAGYRDVVTGLALSFTNNHFEIETATLAYAPAIKPTSLWDL